MKILTVKALKPVRLDKYLMEQFPSLTMGRLNKGLRENKIKLNGKKQPLSTRVNGGDEIKLFFPDDQLGIVPDGPAFLAARAPAEIVYQDEHLLIANKPAGVPIMDDPRHDSLIDRVHLALYNSGDYKPGRDFAPALCHRLDTGTSGLVLVARSAQAESLLTHLIRDRAFKKRYLCVTFGRPQPPAAVLGGFLQKDANRGLVRILTHSAPNAKPVETRYQTLAVSGRLALLKVELITGRTHQIRAHMASIGCPILGDSKYGNNTANRELRFKYQALCAQELQFPKLDAPELQGISGRTFHAPQPWYCQQVLDGTLK